MVYHSISTKQCKSRGDRLKFPRRHESQPDELKATFRRLVKQNEPGEWLTGLNVVLQSSSARVATSGGQAFLPLRRLFGDSGRVTVFLTGFAGAWYQMCEVKSFRDLNKSAHHHALQHSIHFPQSQKSQARAKEWERPLLFAPAPHLVHLWSTLLHCILSWPRVRWLREHCLSAHHKTCQ